MTPVVLLLREIRQAKGLSQRELAKRAGLRRATIAKAETGKTKGIDYDTLSRLADVLDIAPGDLFGRTVAPKSATGRVRRARKTKAP